MVAVTEMGAIVCPPVPAFYQRPQSVQDIVRHSVARALICWALTTICSALARSVTAMPDRDLRDF
jgi:3-polyprenyl-4-hydroxybenzoate decarboxylase